MTANDNEKVCQIVTKRGEYTVPASHAQTWEQRYPGRTPPKGMAEKRFWPTPEGWVIAWLERD